MRKLTKKKIVMLLIWTFVIHIFAGDYAYASPTPQNQKHIVRGLVIDNQKTPLIGVSVRVKGTLEGIATDIEGRYTITVPNSTSDLIFSSVGFLDQTIQVGTMTDLNVQMEDDTELLGEVVVVGMGTQKRETVTGSISKISGTKLEVPTRSLINTLGGQVSGFYTIQSSGEPGNDNASFWIRGVSTFSKDGGNPLVLVDGVPRSMADVAPEEVESFTILKDAASTSIYGAEGANGVVLVTTKRGSAQKTKITYRGRVSMSVPTRLPKFLNAENFMTLFNEALTNDGLPRLYSDERIAKHASGIDPDVYPDVNWMDILKKSTWNTDHNVTFRGGNDKLNFFVSGGWYNETGLYKTEPMVDYDNSTKYNRFNLRSNIDIKVSPSTKLSVNLATQYSDKRAPSVGSSTIFEAIMTTPPHMFPMIFSNGKFAAHYAEAGNETWRNPYNLASASGYHRYWTSFIQSDVVLEQKLNFITEGLTLKGQVSYDTNNDWKLDRPYTPEQWRVTEHAINNSDGRDGDGNLILSKFKDEVKFGTPDTKVVNQKKSIYLEARLTYNRTFAQKHAVSAMANYFQKEYQLAGSGALPFRKQNLTGRLTYAFDSRYIAEVNFGYTGSENFAKGHRFGFFPAASVAWNIANESFFKNLKEYIPELKLKGSIGLTGDDQIGGARFLYRESWQLGGAIYRSGIDINGSPMDYAGISEKSGILENMMAAPNIGWQEEIKRNVAVDLALFKRKVKITAEYFNNRRSNILMQRNTVSAIPGFAQKPYQNFGVMDNYGYELEVELNHQISDVKFQFRGNFSFSRNKIIEYDEIPNAYDYFNTTGKSFNLPTVYHADRLYTNDDFITRVDGAGVTSYTLRPGIPYHKGGSAPKPGDLKVIDLNGDGAIDSYDRSYGGAGLYPTTHPEIMYGFGLTADWRGWYANVFFTGRDNMTVLMNSKTGFAIDATRGSGREETLSRWTQNNPSQDVVYPRLSTSASQGYNRENSTWWTKSGRFLKFKTAEIGYNFHSEQLDKYKISALKIYLQGMNLYSWDDIKIWDPEMGSTGGLRYPLPRTFSFGVQLTF